MVHAACPPALTVSASAFEQLTFQDTKELLAIVIAWAPTEEI